MDRLERLLDLVHVLQSAREPVPLATLKETFGDYSKGSEESIRRKFERDKAELARIGLVLRYIEEDEQEPGYLLDTEASYLPSLALEEDERAVLATAAQAALADPSFPHRRPLRLALSKLGADNEADHRVRLSHRSTEAPDDHGRVEALGAALTARKRVKIVYRKPGNEAVTREVDPYALFLRAGAWYLSGHDHRSGQLRVFRLSRIEEAEMNPRKPGTPDFVVPEGYDLRAVLNQSPLKYAVHEPITARILVDESVAFIVERWWGPPACEGRGDGIEGRIFEVETTYLDHLVDQVLTLGMAAEILSPPSARNAMARALQTVLAAHQVSQASEVAHP